MNKRVSNARAAMLDPEWPCKRCEDLRQNVPVGKPRKLRQVHRVISQNLADGTIAEVESPTKAERVAIVQTLFGVDEDPDPAMPPFAELLSRDSLPDIILYYFRCADCNLLFSLAVDTHHGSGGRWRPEFDEDLV